MPKSKYIKRKTSVDKNNLIKRNTDVIEEEIEQTGNDKRVFVSIKNLQHQYQCFSSWNKNDMNKFWAFNEKVHNMTWAQIFKTGGKTKRQELHVQQFLGIDIKTSHLSKVYQRIFL